MKNRVKATLPLLLVLAGCAGSAGRAPAIEAPNCSAAETLVCYNKTASRLDTRLSEADICVCEQRVDLP